MVKKFTIPFASQGDANDIPDALQVDGKVSFTQGFGYDYERPYDDPQAKDIAREDMNGLFKAITSAVGELQTLGASGWSNAISYPKGAIVYYDKDLYISQVDGNQKKPPQSWVSITSIANDSLKKVANLSDLTNKATARSNLGLGSSATLNKTDTLGTSSNLVATQKLVNDTKVNLESSINAIEDTSKTFLVKSSNLSDLTNKATARNNLGLGSSATLNKTDVLGTSTSLVATQKLVNDTRTNINNDISALQRLIFDAVPVGVIKAYIGETAPNDKWLLCRGQAFSAESYPALAQLLPDLKIPDLRGVALRGLDANRGFDPGRTLLSYQEDALQEHRHGIPSSERWYNVPTTGGERVSIYDTQSTTSGPRGARASHETVMKNVAVNFIIKAR